MKCRVHSRVLAHSLRNRVEEAVKNNDYYAYETARKEYDEADTQEQQDGVFRMRADFLMGLKGVKKYHAELGFPMKTSPKGVKALQYSLHARDEAANDRYAHIDLPEEVRLEDGYLFEIETATNPHNGRELLSKLCYRFPYDNRNDISIVMVPATDDTWFVKTAWLNRIDDIHRTLDPTNYTIPENK